MNRGREFLFGLVPAGFLSQFLNSLFVSFLFNAVYHIVTQDAKTLQSGRPAREFRSPVDGHLAVEIMFADVVSQNARCLIAADPRSKRLVQVSATVTETVADRIQYAAGVGVVFEADSRTTVDRQLLAPTSDDAKVEVGRQTVVQEAFFLFGVVERVETATETQWCRRQLFEYSRMTSFTLLLFASSQILATTAAAAATGTSIIKMSRRLLIKNLNDSGSVAE